MRPLSLRGRLLAVTVGIVAAGLAAAGVSTYLLLRSSLLGRIDEQLLGSRPLATRALFAPGRLPRPRPDGRSALPLTYAGLLDRAGRVVAWETFGFGSVQSPPLLPAGLPGSDQDPVAPERLLTTGAEDGSLRYRVLATPIPHRGGTIVVAVPLEDVDATLGRLVLVEGIAAAIVLGAAGALALWLVRLGLRPLVRMEAAAAAIAAGDLSRRVEPDDDRTEVGRLGRALNAMLERIEHAFAERRASEERLRRFIADASHELRTPLTSIRGYAELFRRGAGERPEDLEKSMRRIEEESARMSTLVEEMLLLARLDQGRPLERAPVDLAVLTRDAVEDARAVQPDRPITLEAPRSVIIEGDEARLRQVAANLIANALQHTPREAVVRVRVGEEGATAVLEVADEGPGLAPEHAARVFDRFFRADPARTRETGTAGLGLSIVAAIVRAHGGEVTLDTAPGAGARFRVRIPRGAAGA